MSKKDEALKLALDAWEAGDGIRLGQILRSALTEQPAQQCKYPNCDYPCPDLPDCRDAEQPAIKQDLTPEQPAQQDEYKYAKRLAKWLWQKHYAKDAPNWVPFDNLAGVLTQIDNMVCRLVKEQPAQQVPVAWRWTESNGRHWFDWRTDWTHHDRAKAMGFAIEYAYTSPPASKPWVSLTDDEIDELDRQSYGFPQPVAWRGPFARAVEAKLKEKNNG